MVQVRPSLPNCKSALNRTEQNCSYAMVQNNVTKRSFRSSVSIPEQREREADRFNGMTTRCSRSGCPLQCLTERSTTTSIISLYAGWRVEAPHKRPRQKKLSSYAIIIIGLVIIIIVKWESYGNRRCALKCISINIMTRTPT